MTPTTATTTTQRITVGNTRDGIQRYATQTVTLKQGDSVQRIAVPANFAQLVQTTAGRHIILTSQQNTNAGLSF